MRLPEPGAGFEWVAGPRPYLVCTALAERAVHAFTTRAWVDSEATAESQDSLWNKVASVVGLGPERLARAVQVHGTTVVSAAEAMAQRSEADVLTADDPSVAEIGRAHV